MSTATLSPPTVTTACPDCGRALAEVYATGDTRGCAGCQAADRARAQAGIAFSPSLPAEREGTCPGCGVEGRLFRVWACGYRYRCGACVWSEARGFPTGSLGPDDAEGGRS